MDFRDLLFILIIPKILFFPSSAVSEETDKDVSTGVPHVMLCDRPMKTLSSFTIGKFIFQFETTILDLETDMSHGVRTTTISTPSRMRFGIHNNMELFAESRAFMSQKTKSSIQDNTIYGFADFGAGLKMHFGNGGGAGGFEPSSGLILSLSFPAGTKDFTNDTFSPKVTVPFEWLLPLSLHLGFNLSNQLLKYKGMDQQGNAREEYYFQSGYSVSLFRTWAPASEHIISFAEFFGSLAVSDRSVSSHSFNAGFAFKAADNLHFDISMNAGISAKAPDLRAVAGVSLRPPD
jgi:hypothetical protein